MALRFKGKPKELRDFLCGLKIIYGEKTTIKEICEMIGAMKNVRL